MIANIFNANAFQENPLDFVLDIHVSNTLLGFFVVGNAYDSVFRWDIDFILGKKHFIISFLQKRAAHCVSKNAGTKLPRLFQHEHNVQQGLPNSAFVKIMKKKNWPLFARIIHNTDSRSTVAFVHRIQTRLEQRGVIFPL